jgi:hypothetical protein
MPTNETFIAELGKRALTSKAAGIKLFCVQCMGGGHDGTPLGGPDGVRLSVRDCTATTCALYPHRPYQAKP